MRKVYSRLTEKSKVAVPKLVRDTLGLSSGDRIRFRVTKQLVIVEKADQMDADDPFSAFSEWASDADEKAYKEFSRS